ncbi:unnamed protein product [Penicillium nalgiovense]|nr:unnamed protein product [Penicillium nalgiovense]
MFPLLESKRASALSARAPRYRCDPMLSHPDMTIRGIGYEPMSYADVSTRYIPQIPMAYTTVCLSAFEDRERIAFVNWTSGVQWVAPRCSRMASGVFSSLIIRQAPSNADVSSCLMAGEPYLRRWPCSETDQVEIYGAASSRCQKCLLWNRCLVDLIPSTHSSIKPQEISGKSHMPWMSLKLQVIKPAACL